MRRRYKRELYSDRVSYIKNKMPHCCIGVDVIVGFPGETEEHFLDTYNFLNSLDVSYFHVFTYSERANTFAAELPGVVPMNVRKERNKMLRILSEKKKRAFYEQFIGTSRNVLFEAKPSDNMITGFTDNYIKVEGDWNKDVINTLGEVALESINVGGSVLVK